MWRLTEVMVRSGLLTAWRLAISPVSTSPPLVNATTDGVVRELSAFAMTVGSPPSNTATTEFVVPRSIPTARDIRGSFPQNFCYKLRSEEHTSELQSRGHLVCRLLLEKKKKKKQKN